VLRALVALELERILPLAGRSLVTGAVVVGVLVATGAFTLPRLAFILAMVGLIPVTGMPLNALRDKLDGGLEFLRVLPASPRTLATARLLAILLVALPGALLGTGAAALSLLGDVPGVVAVRPLAGLFLALTATFVVGGFLATALILRFEVNQASYAPLAFLGVAFVLGRVGEHYLPDPVGTFMGLLPHAWFLPALWAVGLAAALGVGWFALTLATSGIARFSPGKDRLTW
jgi:hypothetical protein